MIIRGECLACRMLSQCRETSVDRVLGSYTCAMFEEASEPVYQARWDAMRQFGERGAVRAMLPLNHTDEGEDADG